MSLPENKDVERLLRSHGWLLDEMREVSPKSAGESRSVLSGVVDLEVGVLERCALLTAVGVRRSPGQFPARQLELLVASGGTQILSVESRTTLGPEPRVTTTRVMLADVPERGEV